MRPLLPLLVAAGVWAQTPPKTPVQFQCVAEELDAAGLSCTAAQPCPVYVEFASLDVVGSKLFLAGNLHTADATLASLLLASEDGGTTWTEPTRRVAGAGIEQIQFLDFSNGWIGGQTLQGRPRDAFLLLTRDGGKTWTSKPIFEESRPGVIQQFWFENKNNGWLLIDRMQVSETGSRYELYESQTGGESWTLLQVSARPLTIKRARSTEANPDWHLRADGPSKSYRIEQKVGDKWRLVSTIPIHVTDCKGAEMPLAEPPPPEEESAKPAVTDPKPPPSLKKKKN